MKDSAQIRDFSISFHLDGQRVDVVEGLTFNLVPGQTLALVGESGSGKSMTSLGLMRLLPFNAFYGPFSKLKLGQSDLLTLPEFLMRQIRGHRIAMIFQEPMTALNPVKTIGKQIAEAISRTEKLSKKGMQDRVLALLEEVEIPDPVLKTRQYPHQLSGGQKQRVMIAMALANHPEILIADEPTTALDLTVQKQILNLLKKLEKLYQMSVFLITHDLGVVKEIADEVLVIYAGEIVEQRSRTDFFKEVKHPYSKQLIASMPSFEKRNFRLETIPGSVPTLEERGFACRFNPRCHYAFEPCFVKKPQLQEIGEGKVRCHLYPDHQHLPALAEKKAISRCKSAEKDEPLLKVTDLSVNFYARRNLWEGKIPFKAVDNVSFMLYRGKTLALVGESGCGKTTLAHALIQLTPIASGSVHYRDKPVHQMNRSNLNLYRRHLQIIFQDPFSSMNPRLTAGEIIAEGMIAQRLPGIEITRRQKKLLELVNLPSNSLLKYPHQFSGGQRQRICIARALATQPEVIICDEPTSALDISVQSQILNLLQDLQQELQISYLFITHNMAVVAYMADDMLVMHKGSVVEQGNTEQILFNPQHAYTKKLLGSVLTV